MSVLDALVTLLEVLCPVAGLAVVVDRLDDRYVKWLALHRESLRGDRQ